ncbi:hypothetical protein GEOBRER4_n0093 [Citrifermentans bremense]|uniref:Uncharacterized protein n=1 Tax=Citrifermentans bremense TaxID=60035 RepID=A0A7R7IYZ9_9BACT|nr:hypothetical protein GEOBRER4_n0093 [Citrifermentans bremense]
MRKAGYRRLETKGNNLTGWGNIVKKEQFAGGGNLIWVTR